MKYIRHIIRSGVFTVLLTAAAVAAWGADPPGRVARLQYMSGSVSVQPQGTQDWVEGSVNRPLTNADNVWADKDSRAELNVGTGLLRISSETSLTLTNITNEAVQVQLHQGTLNVHVRHLYGGEVYEIDTPNLAFTATKSGDYRFDVDPNGDTTVVTVRKGEGEATGQGPGVQVHSGEQAQFSGGNSLAHQIHEAPQPDGFDDWCRVRDQREDHSVSARYVSPGVVGSEDLDEYGTWRDVPEYGHVWVPTAVEPGWAPYRYGHWIWVDPWGWTWVDDAPWGFAPFHYGRWVSYGGYWGWAPGPYWVQPWYAPALVAWFGGPGWGVGFGFGGEFGWCPLGFGEPFFPWYGGSAFYFRNVNITNTRITNITNITNNYNNFLPRNGGRPVAPYGTRGIAPLPRFAGRNGALTAVSRNTLEHSLPVARNTVRVSPDMVRNASGLSRVEASPTRESRLGPNAGVAAARPSSTAASRPTVSRMTPPASPSRLGGTQGTLGRNQESPRARNTGNPAAGARNIEKPSTGSVAGERGSVSMPAPAGRYIPRPPQSLGNSSAIAAQGRGGASNIAPARGVPRPPSAMRSPAGARSEPAHSQPAQVAMNHNVPRPPSSSGRSITEPANSASPRSGVSETARNSVSRPSATPRSYQGPSFGRSAPSSVPRPSGRVMSAPRGYSAPQSRGSYSARSYGGSNPYRGYGERPTYDSPRGGGGGFSGRSYSAPSHSSGSFGGYHGSSGGSSGYHGGGGSSHSGGSSAHGGRR